MPPTATPPRSRWPRVRRFAIAACLFFAPALLVPRWWCGRDADALFDGRREAQEPLARSVAAWVEGGVSDADFQTGHALYNGEWAFGTYLMAAIGLAQVAQAHPELRGDLLPVMETALERMASAEVREYDTLSWRGEDALESLEGPHGHAGCLGYFNLALGVYRLLSPRPKFNDLHDRITAALARRLTESPTGLVETYPGECYPVDNMPYAASLALHDRATGGDHRELLRKWAAQVRARFVDPASGLLYQSVDPATGTPFDEPRASGTALAAYLVWFGDAELSRELFESLERSCATDWIGFRMLKEYPPNVAAGRGDIDSGPVLFGLSLSGTGFNLANCRIHGDRDFYRGSYRIAYLVGSPVDRDVRRTFVCGGPLGNAIMLATLTAGGQW